MSLKSMFDENGHIRLAPKISDGERIKPISKEEQRLIDICLECKKKKCNGNCKEIRRAKNETKIRNY